MKYNINGIDLEIAFIDEEDGAILVYYHRHAFMTISAKEAITRLMNQEFDLEYFADYTINSTSIKGRNQSEMTVLVWLRNPEDYVMIKLMV